MENKTFTGCLEDNRPQEEKAKDWHKATSNVVTFREKRFEDVFSFPVRNQDGSSSCVAQTLALMMGIENYIEEGRFIEFSAKDIYTRRSNNGGGMIGVEALEIARKYGATLEILQPSQNIGESEINKIKRELSDEQIGKIFTIKDYYQLPFSVDSIASIMEMEKRGEAKKPLMVWFMFPRAEWDSKPQLSSSKDDMVHHSVTARDYGIVDGKKGIFVQDSWGLHSSTKDGLRFISEDYIKARMTFCSYVNDKENNWQEKKEITRPVLKKGSKGEYVKELQTLLGIKADGIFGNNTLLYVYKFQRDNGLTSDGVVGAKTWAVLLK